MKELLSSTKHISLSTAKNLSLVDTCFLIAEIKRYKQLYNLNNLCITSFNIMELLHIEHSLPHDVRKGLRSFFKDSRFIILDIPVSPGDTVAERSFVRSIEPDLLKHIADPSDAVLIAAAIKTRSVIYTKDKHHLFTTKLENYLNVYNIKVFKTYGLSEKKP